MTIYMSLTNSWNKSHLNTIHIIRTLLVGIQCEIKFENVKEIIQFPAI